MRAMLEHLVEVGHFKDAATGEAVTSVNDITTEMIVYQWVKDKSVTATERLADCPHLVDPADVAKPQFFVSHAWKGSFFRLVDTTLDFLRNAP